MPFIRACIATADEDPRLLHRLQTELARLAVGPLGKVADVTSVLVERVHADAWRVGGATVVAAAHITISVTAGTNTADEKAAFVSQTYAMLREVLGEALPEATYVVVNEIDAGSWGHGGLTVTEWRRGSATI